MTSYIAYFWLSLYFISFFSFPFFYRYVFDCSFSISLSLFLSLVFVYQNLHPILLLNCFLQIVPQVSKVFAIQFQSTIFATQFLITCARLLKLFCMIHAPKIIVNILQNDIIKYFWYSRYYSFFFKYTNNEFRVLL